MKDSTVSLDFGMYDDLSIEAIEALRQILECEQSVPFTFEEAKEIGTGLLKLFEVLLLLSSKQPNLFTPHQLLNNTQHI